jgi:ribonuclease P protein component
LSLQAKKRVSSENFILILCKNTETKNLVVVVSKKVAARAVDRNRIKRLIKEALRQIMVENYTLKIIVKKNFASAKMAEVKDELAALLK